MNEASIEKQYRRISEKYKDSGISGSTDPSGSGLKVSNRAVKIWACSNFRLFTVLLVLIVFVCIFLCLVLLHSLKLYNIHILCYLL